jgi:hypothetical protein
VGPGSLSLNGTVARVVAEMRPRLTPETPAGSFEAVRFVYPPLL